MAKKQIPPTESPSKDEAAKKRNRRKYLLLQRNGDEGDWEQVCQLDTQNDCKVVGGILRNFYSEYEVPNTDNIKFTLRIIGQQADTF
jgi:hypothetical protein